MRGLLLTLLLLPGLCVAQSRSLGPDAPEAAERRYQIGLKLYRQRDYVGAASEFQVAFEMYPKSARLAFNLARCEERASNLGAAVKAYEAYLKLAPRAYDRMAVEATIAALQKRILAQYPEVVVSSAPAGAAVVLDGVDQKAVTPARLRVAPGSHIVELGLEGYTAETRTLTVAPEQGAAVHVTLREIGVAAEPAEPAPEGPSRTLMWTAFGIGAAGLVGGVALTVVTLGDLEEEERLQEEGTTSELEDARSAADRDYALTQVAFAVGLAGAAAGLTLYLMEDDVGVSLSPGGGVLSVRF